MITTTTLFYDITGSILLSPSAENELKRILKRCDGQMIRNDFEEENEEEEEE